MSRNVERVELSPEDDMKLLNAAKNLSSSSGTVFSTAAAANTNPVTDITNSSDMFSDYSSDSCDENMHNVALMNSDFEALFHTPDCHTTAASILYATDADNPTTPTSGSKREKSSNASQSQSQLASTSGSKIGKNSNSSQLASTSGSGSKIGKNSNSSQLTTTSGSKSEKISNPSQSQLASTSGSESKIGKNSNSSQLTTTSGSKSEKISNPSQSQLASTSGSESKIEKNSNASKSQLASTFGSKIETKSNASQSQLTTTSGSKKGKCLEPMLIDVSKEMNTDFTDNTEKQKKVKNKNKKEDVFSNANMVPRAKIEGFLNSIGESVSSKTLDAIHADANSNVDKFLTKLCAKAANENGMFSYRELEIALVEEGLIDKKPNSLALHFGTILTKEQLRKIEGILVPRPGQNDTDT